VTAQGATQGVAIGVDIGGTFTDVVCTRPGVPPQILKLPTTRTDPSQAVLQSLARMAADWGVDVADIGRFVHGTTVATNAVIERKGAEIGLLTTEGFRDVLEIGRQMRRDMYSLNLEPQTPVFLAPGRRRKEVRERLSAEGEVVVPLDEASVVAAVDALVADGVEAVAICFLFSFLNPTHEQRAAALIRERHPALMLSLSCEVDPAFREYERTVVTAFDAYIKPVIDRYLDRLASGLGQAGVGAPLQIMQSRGGVAAAMTARQRPVRLFLSGPAAGVIGGRMTGTAAGTEDVITVDVGGTSCDIALIAKGKPMIRAEGEIASYPVRVAMVDVNAIGAGGGSIAWLDGAGGLRVGPHSAGSEPGPACYGRGGTEATVTDASVVLGYLDPDYFAGGTLQLQPELARETIRRTVAEPLGLSVEAAALGIHRVVNAQMAEGIRLVSIRQGVDPRGFALLPLGGAGPLHATALARDLGIRRIVVPRHPGVLSAAGLLAAPVEHEASTAFPRPLAAASLAEIRGVLAELDDRCAALMAEERVAADAVHVTYFADVCYIGQSYHLEIPLDLGAAEPLDRVYRDFVAAHDRVYGHATEAPARIVNLRSVHQAAAGAETNGAVSQPTDAAPEPRRRRIMLADEIAPVEAAVHARASLAAGATVDGPAIIEQADTTTLIEPGWRATVRPDGTLVIDRMDS
jgi:N-methylhydantoinase A/oxoprolinase/acetone carboxylase beta subunit